MLVTGGSGFVGRAVLPELLARGFAVHAVSRRPLPDAPAGVVQHRADLLDPAAMPPILSAIRPSHLVHLAWTVTPGRFWRAPENLDWVAASLLLYRAFVGAGGRRVLGVGTCAEYDWTHGLLDEATTPCRPATLYGVAKHALHQLLGAAAVQDGVSLAWGRLFFLYGPHEAPSRLVPDVTLALLRGEPALCGDGTGLRDFMHVADAARALVTVLASTHAGPVNIASGACVPIRDIIMDLAGIVGRPELVRLGARPSPPDDPPRLEASMAVLGTRLGFRPSYRGAAGLAETVAWWRGNTPAR